MTYFVYDVKFSTQCVLVVTILTSSLNFVLHI
jgi:hypothetical protein